MEIDVEGGDSSDEEKVIKAMESTFRMTGADLLLVQCYGSG